MKATQLLHNLGQSLWLDNITRDLLDSGTLQRCATGPGGTIVPGASGLGKKHYVAARRSG